MRLGQIGSGYIGSPSLQVSVASQELVPPPPAGQTVPITFYKFAFMNRSEDAYLSINGGAPILIQAGMGFTMDYMDAPINSIIITNSGVKYSWVGAY